VASYSDEVDLREYVDVLWRWRWFVVAVVVAAGAVAGVLSFFVISPTYEATAELMVPKDPFPAEVILSPHFMQMVIDELQLPADEYNTFRASDWVTVETSKTSTSLTTIKVKNKDPQLAATLANTISQDFVAFLKSKNTEAISASVSYLEEQKAAATTQLWEKRSERDVIKQSGRLEILQRDVDRLFGRIASYQSQVAEGQIRQQELLTEIDALSRELAEQPKTLEGPPDWSGHATQIPNATYQRYEQGLAFAKIDLSELRVRLQEMESTLPSLQSEYDAYYSRLVALQRQLQELETSISELASQTGSLESRITQLSMSLPQTSVAAPALVPDRPVGPRRLMNIAVALVLGGFASVLAVFLMEYWRSPRKQSATG